MTRSMTGYGKAEAATSNGRCSVEIRSVNHRYGEVFVKLPRTFMQFENDIRKCVAEQVKRGKIEVFVQQENTSSAVQPMLNIQLAKSYHRALTSMKEALGLADPVTLALLAAQKDVLVPVEGEIEEEAIREELVAATREAVQKLNAMRLREGAVLAADVQDRLQNLTVLISRIAELAPQAVHSSSTRLRDRLSQLTGEYGLDQARLAQEIAILADRCDVTEELVRFNSHVQQFLETMKLDEPVGRKLDFLLQELNREVNTIGSKANEAEITTTVIELKAEIEKIREQVQNIE